MAALEVGRNKSARMLRLSVLSVLGITGSPTQEGLLHSLKSVPHGPASSVDLTDWEEDRGPETAP